MSSTKKVSKTVVLTESVRSQLDGTPSPGVVNCHNLDNGIYDLIDEGIDLGWDDAIDELKKECRQQMISEGFEDESSEEYQSRYEELYEEKEQELSDNYEGGYANRLVGDWKKNAEGNYEIDRAGKNGWAGSYSNDSGAILVVEWSKWVAKCNETSPCYIRKDTGGRCGDLDTPGSMFAYCLPKDLF